MRIAVFSYKFSPFKGVAANRWQNLSNSLSKLGVDVTVFTVPWGSMGNNRTSSQTENFAVIRTNSGTFHKLRSNQNYGRYFNRIINYTFMIFDKFNDKIDEAESWGKYLTKEFETENKKRPFDIIIATGAPFSVMLHASKIKSNNNKIKLVLDFRDPFWSSKTNLPETKTDLIKLEQLRTAAKNADLIVTVSKSLSLIYEQLFNLEKVHCITNGFNQTKIREVNARSGDSDFSENPNTISLIHAGNLTNGRENTLLHFLERLSKHNFSAKIKIILQGYVNPNVEKHLKRIAANVEIETRPIIDQQESLAQIIRETVCLHIGAKNTPFALSTKVFEYMGIRKPIISLNYGGDIQELLSAYKPSLSQNLNTNENLYKLLKFLEESKRYKNNGEVNSKYSYCSIAKRYLGELELLLK